MKLLDFLRDQRAQGGIVTMVIGLVVAIIVIVAVAIPIVIDVINNTTNLPSTATTVLNQIPVLLAVIPIVLVAGILAFRR